MIFMNVRKNQVLAGVKSNLLETGMDNLIEKIKQWAHDRNLIDGGCPKSQMLKCVSEVGELADNVNKQNDIRDDIGDVLVTLIILAAQHDLSLETCLQVAYDDIKDRKGVLLDGVFIKDTDPRFDGAMAVIAARGIRLQDNQK